MIPGWFPSIGVYEETEEMVELIKAKVPEDESPDREAKPPVSEDEKRRQWEAVRSMS